MEKLTHIETWLPVFPGFYCTAFEAYEDDEIHDINYQRESKDLPSISYADCTWDYDEYQNKIAEKACEFIQDNLSDFITKIEFQSVWSPREYNFRNDSVNINVILSDDNIKSIKEYLINHSEDFSTYLWEKYTSRSGFIPFHSNKLSDWLISIDECLADKHKLGSILNFIVWNILDDPLEDMISYCSDCLFISATNYYELING
jgi:hypothetical protein